LPRRALKQLCQCGEIPAVIEIGQRRNIHVHNHGQVNRQYLNTVDPSLVGQYSAEDGKLLQLSTDYPTAAIDRVSAVSAILSNICWRKWGDFKEADSGLVSQTFEGLNDQRYAFVKLLAGFMSGAASGEPGSLNFGKRVQRPGPRDLGPSVLCFRGQKRD
jgi:hypothetical protein